MTIKASKTDQLRKGVDIYVGRMRNALCPVEALLAYLAKRGTGDSLLFKFEDGRLLTKERFVKAVREAMSRAGIDTKLCSGHSFKIRAATMAEKASQPRRFRHSGNGRVRPTFFTSGSQGKSLQVSLN